MVGAAIVEKESKFAGFEMYKPGSFAGFIVVLI
jgi:hypothetical protein